MADVVFSTDPKRLDLARIHGWLRETYWSPGVRRDVVERAFARSISIGAYDAAEGQVAVARVVSDEASFAWLCDVFVAPSHRGRGLATTMIRVLLADERLQTVRRWCLATKDAHDVYRPLGFSPVDAQRWMELRPPTERWSD